MFARLALAAPLLLLAGTAQAVNQPVTASIGAPGAQTTARALTTAGVETFDALSGYQASQPTTFGGSPHSATIGNINIGDANLYGGAGGTGRFVTTYGTTAITLTNGAVNYFGLWVSALDSANTIAFYDGATQIGLYNLTATLNALPDAAAYRGNPTAPFAGQNGGEAYAFVDFTSTVRFDRIELIQNGGGGFEWDNATVGIAAVPEPATWGLMLAGFGLVGMAARRRRARGLTLTCA